MTRAQERRKARERQRARERFFRDMGDNAVALGFGLVAASFLFGTMIAATLLH